MGYLRQALERPQQLWLRRINFQIHLWAGVVLASYAIVIGVSGSILVFRAEVNQLAELSPWPKLSDSSRIADLNTVIDSLRVRYPHTHIISLMAPSRSEPVFIAVLQRRPPVTVACDPLSGAMLSELHSRPSWISWIADLHENLLGKRPGRVVNGSAAGVLLLLTLTGLVNWWPGIRNWRRAMAVDFRRRWRRVTFDLHSAAGFWSVLFLLMWSASGIYFTWPDKIAALLNRVSPAVNSRPPAIRINPDVEPVKLDFDRLLSGASALSPGGKFEGMIFPSSRRAPLEILMTYTPEAPRGREDTIYFDPYTGRHLATWRYGVNRSFSDWVMWLQTPLHFGTHWGLGVKIIWALFGLMLPLLAVTGLLMYWNRFLSKQWRRL